MSEANAGSGVQPIQIGQKRSVSDLKRGDFVDTLRPLPEGRGRSYVREAYFCSFSTRRAGAWTPSRPKAFTMAWVTSKYTSQ